MFERKLNLKVFLISFLIVGILTALTYFSAHVESEGRLESNIVTMLFSSLFDFFRFPTHTIFGRLISNSGDLGPFLFFGGLILNSAFYSLGIERIITNSTNRSENNLN
jgi:hypothetical protein